MWKSSLALLVVLAISGEALSGDPPKDAPKAQDDSVQTVSIEQWDAEFNAIDQLDVTTIQKISKRRKLAATRLIRREGRIFDIKPCVRDGHNTVSIEAHGLRGPDETVSFVPTSEEASAAEDWCKGDGIGWRERPILDPNGEIRLEAMFSKLSDLIHVAGIGSTPASPATPREEGGTKALGAAQGAPATKHPIASGAEFKMWIQLLDRECEAADWRRAWLVYCVADLWKKTWAFPARAVEIDKASVVVAFDDLKPYWQNWRAAALRWSVGYADDSVYLKRRIDATQKELEGLTLGTEVTVAIDVVDCPFMEDFQAAKGIFRTTAKLLRTPPRETGSASRPGPDSGGVTGSGDGSPQPTPPAESSAPAAPPATPASGQDRASHSKNPILDVTSFIGVMDNVRGLAHIIGVMNEIDGLGLSEAERKQRFRMLHNRHFRVTRYGVVVSVASTEETHRRWHENMVWITTGRGAFGTSTGYWEDQGRWEHVNTRMLRVEARCDDILDDSARTFCWSLSSIDSPTAQVDADLWREGEWLRWDERFEVDEKGRTHDRKPFEIGSRNQDVQSGPTRVAKPRAEEITRLRAAPLK